MAKPNPYGQQHQTARRKLKPTIDNGDGYCTELLCLMPTRWIQPGTPWDLAHDRAATEQHGRPVYLGPAHQRCNRAEGARWRTLRAPHAAVYGPDRRVILICGPPGAGKTTAANALGLDVYDRDDPRWRNNEAAFTQATSALAINPNAQAVVIRSGATQSARTAAAQRIGATETRIIAPDIDTCIRRVRQRNRPHPSMPRQITAIRQWWAAYEPPPTRGNWVL